MKLVLSLATLSLVTAQHLAQQVAVIYRYTNATTTVYSNSCPNICYSIAANQVGPVAQSGMGLSTPPNSKVSTSGGSNGLTGSNSGAAVAQGNYNPQTTVFSYTTTIISPPTYVTTYTTLAGGAFPVQVVTTIAGVTETLTVFTTQTVAATVTAPAGDGLGPQMRSIYYANSSVASSTMSTTASSLTSSSYATPSTLLFQLATGPSDVIGPRYLSVGPAVSDLGPIAELDSSTNVQDAPIFTLNANSQLVDVATGSIAEVEMNDVGNMSFSTQQFQGLKVRSEFATPLQCSITSQPQSLSCTLQAGNVEAFFFADSTSSELLVTTQAGAVELRSQNGLYFEIILYIELLDRTVPVSPSSFTPSSLEVMTTSNSETALPTLSPLPTISSVSQAESSSFLSVPLSTVPSSSMSHFITLAPLSLSESSSTSVSGSSSTSVSESSSTSVSKSSSTSVSEPTVTLTSTELSSTGMPSSSATSMESSSASVVALPTSLSSSSSESVGLSSVSTASETISSLREISSTSSEQLPTIALPSASLSSNSVDPPSSSGIALLPTIALPSSAISSTEMPSSSSSSQGTMTDFSSATSSTAISSYQSSSIEMPSSSSSSLTPSATAYVVALYSPISSPSTIVGYVSTSESNAVDAAEVITDISEAAQFTVELFSPTDTLYNLLGTSTSGAFSGMALGSQYGFQGNTATGNFYTALEATTPKAQGPPSGSGTEEYFDGTGTESAIWEVDLTLMTLTPHWINPDGSDSGPLYSLYDEMDDVVGTEFVEGSTGDPNVRLGLIALY